MNNRLIYEKESLIEYIDILIGIYTVKANKNNKLFNIVNELDILRSVVVNISSEEEVVIYKNKILHLENNVSGDNDGR